MQTVRTRGAQSRGVTARAIRAAVFAGSALLVGACNTDQQVVTGIPETPTDYRLRHPISITEGEHGLEVFIGANRGTLNPTQRAQVLAFAQTWRHDATGGMVVDLPVGTSNEHASAAAMREIGSILAASGMPAHDLVVRKYHPPELRLATVRIHYPRIAAQAGPCGLWPEDIGPSVNRGFFENEPYWNFGCATQRNLAAMVDNPADLVQPRGETPPYAMRRTYVTEKYQQGAPTGTQYPATDNGKISSVGQ